MPYTIIYAELVAATYLIAPLLRCQLIIAQCYCIHLYLQDTTEPLNKEGKHWYWNKQPLFYAHTNWIIPRVHNIYKERDCPTLHMLCTNTLRKVMTQLSLTAKVLIILKPYATPLKFWQIRACNLSAENKFKRAYVERVSNCWKLRRWQRRRDFWRWEQRATDIKPMVCRYGVPF